MARIPNDRLQVDYHRQRALRERDLGQSAASPAAARAHIELSVLHLRRAQELERPTARPPSI